METYRKETNAIRQRCYPTHEKEHSSPLYLTSSFSFNSADEAEAVFKNELEGNIYSRFSNPNTDEFINKLCLLEGTEAGIATASGMAAVYTVFASLLEQGDHILASNDIFGNSKYILSNLLPKFGIEVTFIPITEHALWEKGVKPNTKLLFVETPSNPTLNIADLTYLNSICNAHGILFCVDNCFATPYLQQPVIYGADLILHSATKYIDGQGRVVGGAILGSSKLISSCYDFIRRTGPCLSPFNAWILSKSLETLAIRMDRHCQNAIILAEYLEDLNDISVIYYPHLPSHPQYELAKSQMRQGGGLVACRLEGNKYRARNFINSLQMFSQTANLGDTRSIVTHPASTTHSKLTPTQQSAAGITDNFVRFSVGLEHIDDIIADISQALKKSI